MTICLIAALILCGLVIIGAFLTDSRPYPSTRDEVIQYMEPAYQYTTITMTGHSPVNVINTVKPKIVVAYTKLELLVIYSDFKAADYHLCATFPTSRPLAARACAEALANASGLEVQEHRG